MLSTVKRILYRKVNRWVSAGIFIAIFAAVLAYFWVGIQHRRERDTQYILDRFGRWFDSYVQFQEKLPGNTFSEAVQVVLEDIRKDPIRRPQVEGMPNDYFRMLEDNKDPWGRPFCMELKDGGYLVLVRSFGRNGRDDHGGGDDIQRRIDLRWARNFIKLPATTTQKAGCGVESRGTNRGPVGSGKSSR
jgi:hypothetical protein